jgi:hypothetical protein
LQPAHDHADNIVNGRFNPFDNLTKFALLNADIWELTGEYRKEALVTDLNILRFNGCYN